MARWGLMSYNPQAEAGYAFGKDAPHIKIGCSRPATRSVPVTPGPGQYWPKEQDRKIKVRIANGTVPRPKDPSANCELLDMRVFPRAASRSIGVRGPTSAFYWPAFSPGPCYMVPSLHRSPAHRIQSRLEVRSREPVPSPGDYSPQRVDLPTEPSFSLSGPHERDEWLRMGRPQTPGPGSYARTLSRRLGRVIVLSGLYIHVDDAEEAIGYFKGHQEAPAIVAWIVDEVLREKPDDPISLVRELFSGLEAQCVRKPSYEEIGGSGTDDDWRDP